jgi:hypothetical protein
VADRQRLFSTVKSLQRRRELIVQALFRTLGLKLRHPRRVVMIAAPFMSRAILYATLAAALLGALGMHNGHAIANMGIGAHVAPMSQSLHTGG